MEFDREDFAAKLESLRKRGIAECEKKAHNMNHDMIEHDVCHEGNNPIICHEHDMSEQVKLNKSDWFYLVNTLESWRVYNPRSVVKKNPILAWKVMCLCKDPQVRVKGAYFTTCFRRELAKLA